MSALSPYITLNQPFGEMLAWAIKQLNGAGLRIEQTFDLQVARLSQVGSPCPVHGFNRCDCQMIVLLVYDIDSNPLTLFLYGNDGQYHVSVVNPPGNKLDMQLDKAVHSALTLESVESG